MILLSWFNLIQVIYLFSLSTEDTPRPVFTVRYLLLPVTGRLISCLWNLVQSRWSIAVGRCKMLAMCLFRSSSWYGSSIQVAGTVGNSFLKRHATRFKNSVFFFFSFLNMKDGVQAAAEEQKYKRTRSLSNLAKKVTWFYLITVFFNFVLPHRLQPDYITFLRYSLKDMIVIVFLTQVCQPEWFHL